MAILLLLLTAAVLLGFLAALVSFWLGARAVRAPKASWGRAAIVTLLATVVGVVLVGVSRVLGRNIPPTNLVAVLLVEGFVLFVQLIIVSQIVRIAFATTNGRALLIWLMATISSATVGGVIVFGLKAFGVNAYVVPTNSMAPTITGWHWTDTCPLCQGELVVPAPSPEEILIHGQEPEVLCICESCRKSSTVKTPLNKPASGPDRILVSKLIKPERWDMVAFRPPPAAFHHQPDMESVLWVKRLVGLPGETLVIKDGAVFIDDARLGVPVHLQGLRFLINEDDFGEKKGSPDSPLKLGPNEYAVLGDFPERANDSRSWGPLPGDRIEAVVVGCYWPPNRLRVFRW
jgi:signal peptidase I